MSGFFYFLVAQICPQLLIARFFLYEATARMSRM